MAKGEFKETPQISIKERMKMLSDQDYKCNHCLTDFSSADPAVLHHCHYSNDINFINTPIMQSKKSKKKRLPVLAHNAMR